MKDARHLGGEWGSMPDKYLEEFCLLVMPWHYKNNPNGNEDPEPMIDDGNICMPALWCEVPTLIAYSRDGYESKTWPLPADWQGVEKVSVATVTTEGREAVGEVEVENGRICLSLGENQAVEIRGTSAPAELGQ
jgi:hypothetical protein